MNTPIEEKINNATAAESPVAKMKPVYTLLLGILLLLLGTLGFILPGILSLTSDIILGSLLLAGAIFWGYHTIRQNPASLLSWLKPAILLVASLLLLFYPVDGIDAIALLLVVYLLLDTVGSVILAFSMRPAKGWGWMLSNAIISLLLAGMILINWPAISSWIVGIYVGISLIFDGVMFIIAYVEKRDTSLAELDGA